MIKMYVMPEFILDVQNHRDDDERTLSHNNCKVFVKALRTVWTVTITAGFGVTFPKQFPWKAKEVFVHEESDSCVHILPSSCYYMSYEKIVEIAKEFCDAATTPPDDNNEEGSEDNNNSIIFVF